MENDNHQKFADKFQTLPNEAFIRLPMLLALLPFSVSTLWREIEAGHVPKPVKLTPRTIAWQVGEIRDYLHLKLANR